VNTSLRNSLLRALAILRRRQQLGFTKRIAGVLFLKLFVGWMALARGGHSGAQRADARQPSGRPDQPGRTYEGMALLVRIFFRPLPDKMPGSRSDTPQMVALGRKLYFERSLSLTKTQSCNDCHRLDSDKAGTDGLPTLGRVLYGVAHFLKESCLPRRIQQAQTQRSSAAPPELVVTPSHDALQQPRRWNRSLVARDPEH
jgi:hypothetical protein